MDDERPPEGEKKKGVSREGRGSVSSVASGGRALIEKYHQLFMTTQKTRLLVSPSSLFI